MAILKWVLASLLVALCNIPQPATASESEAAQAAPDHVVPAWYMAMPVVLKAREIGIAPLTPMAKVLAAFPSTAHSNVYIIAPVDPSIGTSPEREIPTSSGPVVLPAHQAVLSSPGLEQDPPIGIGYFVVPAEGTSENDVRSSPRPENGWADAPLASAIRIGPSWVDLNSHIAVEYGLKAGFLELRFFDASARMWTEPFDPSMTQYRPRCNCKSDTGEIE